MVLRSPYPDVQVPQLSLTEYVLGGAAARGDKPALIDGASGAVTTYADFAQRVRSVAAGLAARESGRAMQWGCWDRTAPPGRSLSTQSSRSARS